MINRLVLILLKKLRSAQKNLITGLAKSKQRELVLEMKKVHSTLKARAIRN